MSETVAPYTTPTEPLVAIHADSFGRDVADAVRGLRHQHRCVSYELLSMYTGIPLASIKRWVRITERNGGT